MADKTLVQGAALVAKSMQGPDIAGAIEKGLESGFAPLKEYIKKEEAYNIDKAKKLGAFGDNYNPNALDGENRIFMDKSLRESRMEYSKLLDQTRNLNPSSEEYIDALAKASQIEAGFNQTLEDTLEFSELGAEYIKEAKLGNISAGMTKEDIALFDKIWVDKEYKLVRDPLSGQLSYKVGDQIVSKEKLDDWRIPNKEFAKKFVIDYNDVAYKAGATAGQKLTPEDYQYKQIEFGITQDLKSMPIEEIRSLYKDKMLGNNPLLVEPENLFELSKEQLIPIAVEGLMGNIVNTNLEGIGKYTPPTPKTTTPTKYDKEISVIRTNYESQKSNIEPVLKSFLKSDKTTDDALKYFGRLGLNVTEEVQDADKNVIGIKVKNSEVGEEITISYSDPASALISIHNALGANKIGAKVTLSDEFLTAETQQSELEQANLLLATANSVPETEIPTRIIQTGIFKGRTGLKEAQGKARTQRQIEINSIMQARKRYNELAKKLGLQKVEFPEIK